MEIWAAVIVIVKAIVIMLAVITIVPILVWFERRGAGWIQNRRGPNRIKVFGEKPLTFGLIQPIADAIKFAFKEDIIPDGASKLYYVLAPILMLVTALLAYAVIPFAPTAPIPGVNVIFPPSINGIPVPLMVAPVDIGILFVFAIAGLGVYGVVMAGWSSNSNYAMLGGLRATAQMISYEIAMTLSVIGVIMISGTVDLNQIVADQAGYIKGIVPRWNVFTQILGFVVFITAIYAETNRVPFDLPEGEAEIVAGYHIEYGSMKFMLFYFAEYIAMVTASMLITTLYIGGWSFPGLNTAMNILGNALSSRGFSETIVSFAVSLLPLTVFMAKTTFFLVLFVWVRWTLPRFRYDQLMTLGWKVMLPLSLINIVITAVILVIFR